MNRRTMIAVMMSGDVTPERRYINRVIATIGASNLLRFYPLNDLSGTTAIDKSPNAGNGTYVNTPTLGEPGVCAGGHSVKFIATTYCDMYSAALAAAFNNQELSYGFFFKPPNAAYWADSAQHNWVKFISNDNNAVLIQKNIANTISSWYFAGGTGKGTGPSNLVGYTDGWYSFITTISKSHDRMRHYVNGIQYSADVTGLGVWVGSLAATTTLIGNYATNNTGYAALGWINHVWLATRELTAPEVATLASPFDSFVNFLTIGDSKTANPPGYQMPIIKAMQSVGQCWQERPTTYSLGGYTAQNVRDGIDAALAARTDTPAYVIINLGANDVGSGDPGAGWKTNTDYIVDAIHAKWAGAKVYLTKIWRRDAGNGVIAAGIAACNGYIDQLVADANHAGWLFVGVNEADFLPGGDNGATNTSDGVHFNAAGANLWGAAWKTALGY